MKKFSLTLLFGLFALYGANAQNGNQDQSAQEVSYPHLNDVFLAPQMQKFANENKLSSPGSIHHISNQLTRSNKTTGELSYDTLTSHLFDRAMLGEGSKCNIFYSNRLDNNGKPLLIYGTSGSITIMQGSNQYEGYVSEHAATISISKYLPPRNQPIIRDVYVWFAQGTVMKNTGDDFRMRLYEITSNRYVEKQVGIFNLDNTAFGGSEWTPSRFPIDSNSNWIHMNAGWSEGERLKAGNYLLSLEVKTQTNDDTLSLHVFGRLFDCFDATAAEELMTNYKILIRRAENFEPLGFVNMNPFWNGQPEEIDPRTNEKNKYEYMAAPAFYPISTFVPTSIDDNVTYMFTGNVGLKPIYPNPAQDIVNIGFETTSNDYVQIQVIDMNGKVVYRTDEEPYAKGTHFKTINVSDFPCGTYTYIVRSHHGGMGSKFIIER